MKIIRLLLLSVLISSLSSLNAQDGFRTAITAENATEVELLARVGWYDELHLFDPSTNSINLLVNPLWPAWVITFSLDGTLFALGNDNNEVVIFDVIEQSPFITNARVFRAHQGPVYSLAFHPDGHQLASGSSDGMIYVWDIATGEVSEIIEVSPHSAVYGLAYSVDGEDLHCATFRGHGQVRRYSEDARCIVIEPSTAVYSVTFSPNGTLFAYGDTVLTNLESSPSLTLQTRRGWSDSYRSSRSKLVFSADGSVLLNGGTNQDAYIWHMNDLANGRLLLYQQGLLALSPDGSLVAGRNLVIFDTTTGEMLHSLEPPNLRSGQMAYSENLPHDAVFSPDGTLIVTASINGLLRFWGIPSEGR